MEVTMSTRENYKDNVVAYKEWLTKDVVAEFCRQMDMVELVDMFKTIQKERNAQSRALCKTHRQKYPKPKVRVRAGKDLHNTREGILEKVNVKYAIVRMDTGAKFNVPFTLIECIHE
jgi:hypothetical protein